MSKTSLPSFKIISDGSVISDLFQVLSINVEVAIYKIATATIVIKDGDTSNQTFDATDTEAFAPGSIIQIELGYHSSNNPVFKGVVVQQSIGIEDSGASILTVTCKDLAIKTVSNHQEKTFEAMTSSAIIKTIANEYSLEPKVSPTEYEHPKMVQYKIRDWDFMISLCEREGLMLLTKSGTIEAQPPALSSKSIETYEYGNDVWSFELETIGNEQLGTIKGSSWDYENQVPIEVTAKEPQINKQGNIAPNKLAEIVNKPTENFSTSTTISQIGLQAWMDAALLKNRLSAFRGSIKVEGNHKLIPNSLVELKGFGKRFSGDAFVTSVEHIVEDGIWHTELGFGLKNEWFAERSNVSSPDQKSTMSFSQGLQVGIVKSITEDPLNNTRILVTIPFLDGKDQSIWARWSTSYSGENFGIQFMPEIGSEVIVSFMNNDSSYPVVIGTLFNTQNPPPVVPSENVDIKQIKTKSGTTISFNDTDDKVELIIETKNGNKISMSEELDKEGINISDFNGNEVSMTAEGMALKAAGDLSIASSNAIKIAAKVINISADDELTLSGGKASMESSQGALTINSKAKGEISSNGPLNLKGSLVNIN